MSINPSKIKLFDTEKAFFQKYVPDILSHTVCLVHRDPDDSNTQDFGNGDKYWIGKYSGTMMLLKPGESCFGVTCSHVIQNFRDCIEKDSSIELMVKEHTKPEFTVIQYGKSEDKHESYEGELDTFILPFSDSDISALALTPLCYDPSRSEELRVGDVVLIVGFPTPWTSVKFRENQPCEFTKNYCLALKMLVSKVTENQFKLISDEPPCFWISPDPDPNLFTNLGNLKGISGAGVYMFRDDEPILCGIVTRGWGTQKVYCTRIRCVQKDGKIAITQPFKQLVPMTLLEKIKDSIETTGCKNISLGLGIMDETIHFCPGEEAEFQDLVNKGILYQPDKTNNPNLFRLKI